MSRSSPNRGGKLRLEVPLTRYSAVAAFAARDAGRVITDARRVAAGGGDQASTDASARRVDPHKSVIDPQAVSVPAQRGDAVRPGMLAVDGGRFTFTLRHMRRECGCYPDPGTPPDKWDAFLIGTPHDQRLEHRVSTDLAGCRIDAAPVTNGQFEEFLIDSGYRPKVPDNFLKHWGGDRVPRSCATSRSCTSTSTMHEPTRLGPGKRLPSEWEWHCGATQHGAAFRRGEVWEWTEGVRDDGHTRFIMLRGGCRWQAVGSIWYFPTGPQPIDTHAKFLLLAPGLDRCATIGFRCAL